ncbi:molybdopterin molybdotransferase MoeA [Candidatus Fermentibacteria bacterium]|nr:molybdopterin molybdotransferase MoeA [Candidatus Fermentibacteria bacterium]
MMPVFDKALELVLESVEKLDAMELPLSSCCGRALAEDVHSDIDMPPFDRSAMDGYALCGEAPSYLIKGGIHAGEPSGIELGPGEAASIMTGAPVPPGADRVLMKECAILEGGRLKASEMPSAGAHICRRAEDIEKGDRVLEAGIDIEPRHLGIAAMAGRAVLRVVRAVRAGILTTGSEVVPPGSIPGSGQVRNANLPMLEGLLTTAGFECSASLHSADDPRGIREAFERLLADSDVVLAAGGISLGDRDCVAPSLESVGARFLFREVAIKPGKPLSFGMAAGKPVFGLPGNPVSVLCTFEEFVLPALRKMSGFARFERLRLQGISCFDHSQKPGRHNLLRVIAMPGLCWELALPPSSGSGDLMSTNSANAIAHVSAERTGIAPGDTLSFSLFHSAGPDLSFT